MSKLDADLCTNTFSQLLAMELIGSEQLDAYVLSITKSYCEKKRLLVEGLRESNLTEVEWTNPEGGMFRWPRLTRKESTQKGSVNVPSRAGSLTCQERFATRERGRQMEDRERRCGSTLLPPWLKTWRSE
ncbi:MAG: hypothetical protein JRN46_03150 [Nitrososphaerota archaeon]|nr:hypothetical protein [Nitrososphaerota archaeon]